MNLLPFDICRWLVEGEDEEVVQEVLVRPSSALDQQALTEAVRISVVAIVQACAVVN